MWFLEQADREEILKCDASAGHQIREFEAKCDQEPNARVCRQLQMLISLARQGQRTEMGSEEADYQ